MTGHMASSRFGYICRRFISFLLRYSPSNRVNDLLLWPISKRLFKRYTESVEIDDGVFLKVYGDMADMVNKILLFTGDWVPVAWEPGTARLVKYLSDDCDLAIVAGSHIGYYPVIIGKRNNKCKIYAFEPNPINRSRCLENIQLNDLNNVVVVDRALGKNEGQEKMYFDFGQSSFVNSNNETHKSGIVRVSTLDRFNLDSGLETLMILDAEGYEKNIIEGGINFINKNKPTIIFEINEKALRSAGSSSEEICMLLQNLGYNLYVIDEGSHGISFDQNIKVNLIPYKGDRLKGRSFVNLLAIIDINKINRYVH